MIRVSMQEKNASYKLACWLKAFICDQRSLQFVCIGTAKVPGDSLGPIVGSRLQQMNYDVLGTLDDQINAKNLSQKLQLIDPQKTIIAIDAVLSKRTPRGYIIMRPGEIIPGKGVGKKLEPVGDLFIGGVIGKETSSEVNNFMAAMTTPVYLVENLADIIVKAIVLAIPVITDQKNVCSERRIS